jgi:hypothetical protein
MRLRAGQRVGAVFHADRTHLLCVRGVDRIYRASTPFISAIVRHEHKPNRFCLVIRVTHPAMEHDCAFSAECHLHVERGWFA